MTEPLPESLRAHILALFISASFERPCSVGLPSGEHALSPYTRTGLTSAKPMSLPELESAVRWAERKRRSAAVTAHLRAATEWEDIKHYYASYAVVLRYFLERRQDEY